MRGSDPLKDGMPAMACKQRVHFRGNPLFFCPFPVTGVASIGNAISAHACLTAGRSMKNLQVRIKKPPNGTCSPDDFELFEGETPAPGRGEMLCRSRWLSLDPLNGAHPAGARATGNILPAQAICEVVDSRHEVFNVGD